MQDDSGNILYDENNEMKKTVNNYQNGRTTSEDEIISYIHQIPLLPDWTNERIRYPDMGGDEYFLNVYHLQCNCPEFEKKSKKFKYRDIRKLCLHLYHTLQEDKYKSEFDDLTKFMLDAVFKHRVKKFYKTSIEKTELIIGIKNIDDWINIYINDSIWNNYSYHPFKRIWEYDKSPSNREKVQFWIEAMRLYAKLGSKK